MIGYEHTHSPFFFMHRSRVHIKFVFSGTMYVPTFFLFKEYTNKTCSICFQTPS